MRKLYASVHLFYPAQHAYASAQHSLLTCSAPGCNPHSPGFVSINNFYHHSPQEWMNITMPLSR